MQIFQIHNLHYSQKILMKILKMKISQKRVQKKQFLIKRSDDERFSRWFWARRWDQTHRSRITATLVWALRSASHRGRQQFLREPWASKESQGVADRPTCALSKANPIARSLSVNDEPRYRLVDNVTRRSPSLTSILVEQALSTARQRSCSCAVWFVPFFAKRLRKAGDHAWLVLNLAILFLWLESLQLDFEVSPRPT